MELATAWHLKVFRREIRLETIVHALGDLEADVEAGIWEAPAYDLADVYDHAEGMAKRHAATLGVRTLDIMQSPPLHASARRPSSPRIGVRPPWRRPRGCGSPGCARSADVRATRLRLTIRAVRDPSPVQNAWRVPKRNCTPLASTSSTRCATARYATDG